MTNNNNNNIGTDHHQSRHTQQQTPREAEQVLQTCRHSPPHSINVNKYVYDKNLKGRTPEEGGTKISGHQKDGAQLTNIPPRQVPTTNMTDTEFLDALNASINAHFDKLKAQIGTPLDGLHAQLDGLHAQLDAHFDKMNAHFDKMNAHIDRLVDRLDAHLDAQFDTMNPPIDRLEMNAKISQSHDSIARPKGDITTETGVALKSNILLQNYTNNNPSTATQNNDSTVTLYNNSTSVSTNTFNNRQSYTVDKSTTTDKIFRRIKTQIDSKPYTFCPTNKDVIYDIITTIPSFQTSLFDCDFNSVMKLHDIRGWIDLIHSLSHYPTTNCNDGIMKLHDLKGWLKPNSYHETFIIPELQGFTEYWNGVKHAIGGLIRWIFGLLFLFEKTITGYWNTMMDLVLFLNELMGSVRMLHYIGSQPVHCTKQCALLSYLSSFF